MRALIGAYASVLFARHALVGALVAAVTFVGPAAGLAGLVAVIAGTATATALGYRKDAIASGHYGYNALLVGLAAALHHPFDLRVIVLVALAGIASAVLTAVLGDLLHRGAALPVLARPFVVLASALVPALDARPPATAGVLDRPLVDVALGLPSVIDVPLRSFGAIVFAPMPICGAIVVVALACYSRIATAVAIAGILAAYAMARVLDVSAPATELAMSYNGALAAIMIGAVSFVPGRAAFVAGVAAALLAAWLTVGANALLARAGLGVLAWPFVVVGLGRSARCSCARPIAPRTPARSPDDRPSTTPRMRLRGASGSGSPGRRRSCCRSTVRGS